MLFEVYFIVFLQFICYLHARSLPETTTQHMVEETQHTSCSISSDDIAATANATITRQLRGICTSAHLDNRLDTLEKIIIRELNDIKDLLIYPDAPSTQIQSNDINTGKTMYENPYKKNYEMKQNTLLKSANTAESKIMDPTIFEEIKNTNMTITKDDTGITFIYFWEIDNIFNVMSSHKIIESGDFHFAGYHVYMRLIPQLTNNKNMFIQVIGIGEFDLAHQFSILSQVSTEHDIFSPIFINCEGKPNEIEVECEGFEILQDILTSKKLIKNEMLIVKLMIYL